MSPEFVTFLKELAQLVWPFRLVHQWERAGYYVFGKWFREVGPGLKLVVPWFFDVKCISMAPWPAVGTRQDVTLDDDWMVSFVARGTARVTDVYSALNDIEDCEHSTLLHLEAALAAHLATVPKRDLAPIRPGLMEELAECANAETQEFGVELTDVSFQSFVLVRRTYRLLTDTAAPAEAKAS